jgi:hypothetical protein
MHAWQLCTRARVVVVVVVVVVVSDDAMYCQK